MAFNTPVAAFGAVAGIAPPIEADAFSFNANTYGGSGNWEDEYKGNLLVATAVGNPTWNAESGATGYNAFWDFDGSGDRFKIDNSQITNGKLWSSQGVTGGAEGSLEWVIRPDVLSDSNLQTPFSFWNSSETNRACLFGNIRSTTMSILFQSSVTGTSNRTYKTMNHGLSNLVFQHWMLTWSMSDNYIRIYVNNSLVDSETWTNTGVAWNNPSVSCPGIGDQFNSCTSYQNREFDGDLGAIRGYNDPLSTTQISELYNFWDTYYFF
jgi:hypothetical protein